MPNRKPVADEITDEDRTLAAGEPGAEPARGADREQTPPADRARHAAGGVIEDVDPDETDPGHAPRTPI